MKSLDEAIEHAREVSITASCEECRKEHLQLAEWLEELKTLREQNPSVIVINKLIQAEAERVSSKLVNKARLQTRQLRVEIDRLKMEG